MPERVRHPIFARFYKGLAAKGEARGAAEHRERLLAGLTGRVVEVGAGTGMNFGHYPSTVTDVLAVEPEPYLRDEARRVADRAPVNIRVVDGTAAGLPAPDGSFDVGVASLVLCSVSDQQVALAELFRVIRPGGQLRFYEHVRSGEPRKAKRQDRADRIWPLLGGGCHCNRDTEGAIAGAGFSIERCERFDFRPSPLLAMVSPIILGAAVRP
jgi:ubiquinone/menaquinone biosynthesis C-methylase UbiE